MRVPSVSGPSRWRRAPSPEDGPRTPRAVAAPADAHRPVPEPPADRRRPRHGRLRQPRRSRQPRVGPAAPRRPRRPLRRGGRGHRRVRAEPPAGRRGLELDQPAVRRHPPRHRQPRGPPGSAARRGHRRGHPHRALRRQQQLVRRLGVLAAQAARLGQGEHPQRRPQVLAGQRAAHLRGPAVLRRLDGDAAGARLRAARLPRRHPAAPGRPGPVARGRPLARRVQRRGHRAARHDARPRSAAATSRAPRPRRGRRPSRRTAPSSRPTIWRRTTRPRASRADKDIIAYCRIGERSSHTWFVLHELLGYPKVRNYDGSWTEWGSMVNVPIERS